VATFAVSLTMMQWSLRLPGDSLARCPADHRQAGPRSERSAAGSPRWRPSRFRVHALPTYPRRSTIREEATPAGPHSTEVNHHAT
jgi:hypothetical protein